jgi:hypothetical protein
LGADVAVKMVTIFNRKDMMTNRLSYAKVSLIDSAGKYLETYELGKADGILEFNIPFGLSETSISAWKPTASPTDPPLLTDACRTQLKAQFRKTKDLLDSSVALVFGNKTTIGQVCSFAKGLQSNTVTNIPGFCCLDAPYQSKIDEWGEKVSLLDASMEECWYRTVTFRKN